jgi:hypothetical protein
MLSFYPVDRHGSAATFGIARVRVTETPPGDKMKDSLSPDYYRAMAQIETRYACPRESEGWSPSR